MRSKRRRAREDLQLGLVRFRKLLADARRLDDLVADAREKAGGDFIFDRQYVVATVDEAVALAGQLAFHAAMLAPDRCAAVDHLHDGIRAAGRARLAAPPPRDAAATEPGGDPTEALPEFRLLADVIAWLDGPARGDEPTVLSLADAVLDLAIASLDDGIDADLEIDRRLVPGAGGAGAVEVIDLGGRGTRAAPGEVDAGPDGDPLALLLHGAGGPGDGRSAPDADATPRARAWLAVIDDRRLSLLGGPGRDRFHLEASPAGDPATAYVFVGARGGAAPSALLPDAMTMRRTPRGWLAWLHGAAPRALEDVLTHLGARLFGGAAAADRSGPAGSAGSA